MCCQTTYHCMSRHAVQGMSRDTSSGGKLQAGHRAAGQGFGEFVRCHISRGTKTALSCHRHHQHSYLPQRATGDAPGLADLRHAGPARLLLLSGDVEQQLAQRGHGPPPHPLALVSQRLRQRLHHACACQLICDVRGVPHHQTCGGRKGLVGQWLGRWCWCGMYSAAVWRISETASAGEQ